MTKLEDIAHGLRCDVLRMYYRAGWGHIASALSCTDILTAVYFGGNYDDERDHVILSKGHGCAVLYAVLAKQGRIKREELTTFYQFGSRLTGLADATVPGVDAPTGSLGMGLGFAVGQALAEERYGTGAYTYAILGDGELQEGAVWEAAMFAGNECLSSLTVIVDCNGLQASGAVKEIASVAPLAAKWQAFGWQVIEADGHNIETLQRLLDEVHSGYGCPVVILARTIKGKGFPAAEGQADWHSRRPTEVEWVQAATAQGMTQEELMFL